MIKVTSDPKDQEVAVTFMKKNSQPPTDSLPALKETLHGLWFRLTVAGNKDRTAIRLTFIRTMRPQGRECKCNFLAAMEGVGVCVSDASWKKTKGI